MQSNSILQKFERPKMLTDDKSHKRQIIAEIGIDRVGNDTFGYHNLKATIPFVLSDGDFPNPDIGRFNEISEEMAKLARQFALDDNADDVFYAKISKAIVGLTIFFAPELEFRDDYKLRCLLYLLFICFANDETMDKAVEQGLDRNTISKNDINTAIKTFKDIIDGKYKEVSDIPKVNFPSHKNLCEIILNFVNYCAIKIENFNDKKSVFVNRMGKFFDREAASRCEFRDIRKTEMDILFLRKVTMGGRILLELKYMLFGISIDEDLRKNTMLSRFNKAADLAMAITNDLMSLRKEIKANENDNLILIKMQNDKLTLPQAFAAANNLLNTEIERVIDFGRELLAAFPENMELKRYIELTKNAIDGHLRWYGSSICTRYGSIKFDIQEMDDLNQDIENKYRLRFFLQHAHLSSEIMNCFPGGKDELRKIIFENTGKYSLLADIPSLIEHIVDKNLVDKNHLLVWRNNLSELPDANNKAEISNIIGILALHSGEIRHIACVADGNRRWAYENGLNIEQSHKQALTETLPRITEDIFKYKVHTLSLWIFQERNILERSKDEVIHSVFRYLRESLIIFLDLAKKLNIRIYRIGNRHCNSTDQEILRSFQNIMELFDRVEEETSFFTKHHLIFGANYEFKDDWRRANIKLQSEKINADEMLSGDILKFTDVGNQPYPCPDLFLRPAMPDDAGRTGGFLPDTSNACSCFTHKFAPELTIKDFIAAAAKFSHPLFRYKSASAEYFNNRNINNDNVPKYFRSGF
jgi:undecaprenyl diphosphate synthase